MVARCFVFGAEVKQLMTARGTPSPHPLGQVVAPTNSASVARNVAEDHEDVVIVRPEQFQRRGSTLPTLEGYRWLARQVEKERDFSPH